MDEGWGTCIKISLFIVNVVICLGGLTMLALGMWSIFDESFSHNLLDSNMYSTSIYTLMSVGIFISMISCCGFFGSAMEIKCLLISYFLTLSIFFVSIVLSCVLGYVYRQRVQASIKESLFKSMPFYHQDVSVANFWDDLQTNLHCCGVDSFMDWKDFLPYSCCEQPDPQRKQKCFRGPTLQMTGCYNITAKYVQMNAFITGGVGLGLALVLILGMTFSCILCLMIQNV